MPRWLDAGRLRGAELDLRGAQALHRAAGQPALHGLLALCSRLADGPLWVGLVAPLLWSFAALVGLARIVLGLHFPSDVVFGALIGLATGSLVLQVA